MLLSQIASVAPHLAYFLSELIRRLLTKILFQLLQLPLRSSRLGNRLRELSFLQRLRGFTNALPCFVELFASVGQTLAILGLIESLSKFIDISQQLLLLLAQAFELSLELLLLFVRFCFLQRRFNFLQLVAKICLTLSQLTKSIECLQILPLLLLLLRLIGLLGFVAAIFLLQLQLLQLILISLILFLLRLATLLLLLTHDLMFSGAQGKQSLIRRLFVGQRIAERFMVRWFYRASEILDGILHVFHRLLKRFLRLGIFEFLQHFTRLLKKLLLTGT